MRITRRQDPSAKALQLRMRRNHVDEPNTKSTASILIDYEDIRKPGKCCEISNYSRKSDLLINIKDPKVERIFNRALHDGVTTSFGPVRSIREKVVNEGEIETRAIGGDEKILLTPLVGDVWLHHRFAARAFRERPLPPFS